MLRNSVLIAALAFLYALCLHAQTRGSDDKSFERGVEAMKGGRLEEAAEAFSSAIKAHPNFAEGYLNLGLVLEEQRNFPDAVRNLERALALKATLRGTNLFLGIAKYRLDQLDQAAMAVTKETVMFPKDASAWMWLGVIRLAQDQPDAAVKALDKAVELEPKNTDILYHRGRAHLLISKGSYEQMYAVDPKSWRVHQVLAQANAEAEKRQEAITEYEAAIKLAPTQIGLHAELASELSRTGKLGEAVAEYRRELQLDAYNALARFKLGTILVEIGNAQEGKAELLNALRQRRDLPDADYYLGRAEASLGNNLEAAQAFKRVIASSTDPDVIQLAWYQLAMAYRKLQRTAEAQEALSSFQRLKNESAERQQQQLVKKRNELLELQSQETPTESEKPN